MAAEGDNLYTHLDMDKSWLSDHPLVSTMVHIPVDPVGEQGSGAEVAPAPAAAAKDRTHFKVKMGAFNVLSRFASQVGTNAHHVSLEKDLSKPLNQKVYLEIFDILIGDAPNLAQLTNKVQKQQYFSKTKSEDVPDLDALVAKVVSIINENADLKEKSITRMKAFLSTLAGVNFTISNAGSIKEITADVIQKLIDQVISTEQDLIKIIKYVLLLGKKVVKNKGAKELVVSQSRESVHKSLIDNVLNSNNMGGFAFTNKDNLQITQTNYDESKKEFLRKVISKFFERSPENPDVSICVCPEYDYDEDCKATSLNSSSINTLDQEKGLSLLSGGFSKLSTDITPNDNFCRKVFIKVHQDGINCQVTQTQEKMYYFDEKKGPNFLKPKDSVDKLTITLEREGSKTSFVLFSVHLDSTTMSSYKTQGHPDRYKKLMETYQLMSLILREQTDKPQIPIFLVGDFNCSFELLSGQNKYLNTFNSLILEEQLFSKFSETSQGEFDRAFYKAITEVLKFYLKSSPTKILFNLAIPQETNGTPKNRVFGFYNAQAEKGDDLREYNTDNILLVEGDILPQIKFTNQILTVNPNKLNDEVVSKDFYPLYIKTKKVTQGVSKYPHKSSTTPVVKEMEELLGITTQGGGSRKRNRKRNKKSLKKRNKRKSSRKKSKNPRKKRSKRR